MSRSYLVCHTFYDKLLLCSMDGWDCCLIDWLYFCTTLIYLLTTRLPWSFLRSIVARVARATSSSYLATFWRCLLGPCGGVYSSWRLCLLPKVTCCKLSLTALYGTALYYIALCRTALHRILPHCIVTYCTALCNTPPYCTTPNCSALHCTASHGTVPHCTAS